MPDDPRQLPTQFTPAATPPRPAAPAEQPAGPPPTPPRSWRRRWVLLGAVAVVVVAVALWFSVPWLHRALTTVSTNDAYVGGDVTYVSPRIAGYVERVYVNDTDQVEAGQVLVQLDPEPYRLTVAQREAALEVARAELDQARAQVRAQEATARAGWYKLKAAQEQVRYQIATLRANVATQKVRQAELTLAEQEYKRYSALAARGAATQEEAQRRRADLDIARNQFNEGRQTVQRTRAALGLPPNEEDPLSLPPDLEQTNSTVQADLSQTLVALGQLGLTFHLFGLTPEKLYSQLTSMDADFNKTLDRIVEQAPATKLAEAKVKQAERDLELARLNASYTVLRAPVAGIVYRKSVNEGDNVQPRQNLLAIRPLSGQHVWIDANFKETQLDEVLIGQPVDIYVDAYPGRVFKGRVAGFTPGTGSTLALLPPENATGNFVKVVQRLPVRIELEDYDPEDAPLFAGLSVVPYVKIKEPQTGPNAGQRIRTAWQPRQAPAYPPPQIKR